jgi:hypothetical protein
MYNLHYVPTTLGVQSSREIISGGTRTKKVDTTGLEVDLLTFRVIDTTVTIAVLPFND